MKALSNTADIILRHIVLKLNDWDFSWTPQLFVVSFSFLKVIKFKQQREVSVKCKTILNLERRI